MKTKPGLKEFKKATEVLVTDPDYYRSLPHFYSVDCYGRSFEVEKGEFGMLFIRGKVSLRLFQ